MAKYVKVSCLGTPLLRLQTDIGLEEAIQKMTEYWQRELEHVVYERPDMIVLPEICDNPAGFSDEKRDEFYRFRGDRIRDVFSKAAQQHQTYIAYSAMRELPDGTFRNSTQLLDRSGSVAGIYNKNHLTIQQKHTTSTLYGRTAPA